MRVLFFNISGKGGVAHYNYCLCKALTELGIDIILVTNKIRDLDLSNAGFKHKQILYSHYDCRSYLGKGIKYLLSLIRFFIIVLKDKPDIIHWHELRIPVLEYLFIKSFRRQKRKIVLTAHDLLYFEKGLVKKSRINIYNTFDRIIVHAERNKQVITTHYKIPPQKISIIPHGEYSNIVKVILEKKDARNRLKILPDRKVILFFGYIRKYKGLRYLLEALARVRDRLQDIYLIIAGEPKEDFAIYERYINQLDLSKFILTDIRYIPMELVPIYFSASDIVALPYTYIFQSGLLYLAFAYKRPVIVTDVGGIPEIVEQGKNGFIVPPRDSQSLAKTIINSFSDISRLEQMGENAYIKSKRDFSWQSIAQSTNDIYKQLIKIKIEDIK